MKISQYALALVALVPVAAEAQVYTSSQLAAPFVPVVGGTAITFGSNDDDSTQVALPFTFEYFGVNYTKINVATNGYASLAKPCTANAECGLFGGTCNAGACEELFASTGAPGPFPDVDDPQSILAPFWDDLYVQAGSQVLTAVEGAAPNRVFVVEWRNIGHYPSGTAGTMNFQVRLSEAGTVRLAWGTGTVGANSWNGDMGIEDPTGTVGFAPNLACVSVAGSCTFADFTQLSNQALEVGPVDGPELVGVVRSPPGADPGQQVRIGVTARNIGTQSTTVSITAEIYLSSDAVITPGADTRLGQVTIPVIPAREARTATLTTNLPAMLMPGRFRIGAIVDSANRVREASEGNNTAVGPEFLVGPDLAVVVGTPMSSGPGEVLSVPLTINSVGSPLQSALVRVHLSADTTLDAGDLLVTTATAALAGAASLRFDATGVLPANIQPGNYYVIAVVDPLNTVVELDEANNRGVTAATFRVIGPDLAVTEVDCAAVGYRGQPYTVTGTIRNVGGATARDFTYTIYLSDNQLITATDPILCEFGPVTLAPLESRQITHTCTVSPSAQLGTTYVGLIADSTTVVLEEDERDNIRFRRPAIEMRDPAPDFSVTDVAAAPLGAVGEAIAVGRVIDNVGNAQGALEYAIYLSRDNRIDPMSDVEIGRGMASLGAGQRDSGVDEARIPSAVAPGVYYVGYLLDPANAVAELDESNNSAATGVAITVDPGQLRILTDELAPATVGLPYQVDLAAVGGDGSYTWSVISGDLPPGIALDPATGRLSGNARRAVDVRVGFRVTDGASRAEAELRLLVTESTIALEVITRSVPPAFVSRDYEFPLTAIGGVPPYVWTSQGAIPAGLLFSRDGVISGKGTTVGPATVTFRVTDAAGAFVERPITVRVIASDDALRFTDDVLRDGIVNRPYEDRFRAEGGQAPYVFSQIDGEIPLGLRVEDDKLVGTPTVAGIYVLGVRVGDARGDFDTNRFVVTIEPTDDGVRFVTNSLPVAETGTAYFEEGGTPVRLKAISPSIMGSVRFRVITGALPPGLALSDSGEIAGAPTASGVFPFTAEARDDAGQTDHRALAIVVNDPPVPPVVTPPESGCGCASTGGAEASLYALLALGLLLARRRRALAAVALVALGAVGAQEARAQGMIPYFLSEAPEAYVARSGGTVLSFGSTDDDDADVTLPFSFRFFGNQYTTVTVGTNGYVAFGQSAASLGNGAIPSSSTPNNLIAVFWDDLVVTEVRSVVEGNAPSRIAIIQWVARRLGAPAGDRMDFQLWLYEGAAGRFEARYGGSTGASALTGTIGFENATGQAGSSWRTCSPNCTQSDLVALDGTLLRALQDGGTELIASAITTPARTFAGAPFFVDGTITSIHQNAIGPFTYAYSLLPASGMGAGTTFFTSGPTTLTGYQVLQVHDEVRIPVLTPPGRYRVALVVDSGDAVTEPDETNNSIVSRSEIVVGERHPDFTATRIAAPATAAPGDRVNVVVDLANVGNLDGGAAWQLVLSANRVISADDAVLHSGMATLALQATETATVPVTIPSDLPPGRYSFGVIFDPSDQVLELSEVNNAVASARPTDVGADFIDVATEMLPGGYTGVSYSAFLRGAGGDGSYTWELASGALPMGLALTPSTGEISGTPTAAGAASFTVRVTSGGRTAEQALGISIAEPVGPLTIVTRALLPGVVGQPYPPADGEPQRLRTVNASGDVHFRLIGAPPSGLSLADDGLLSGVPIQRGVFDVEVEARDGTTTATRSIPLTVVEPGRLGIIAAALPDAVLDEEYRFQLGAVGVTSTVTFGTADVLPDGVTLTTSGLLVGVPTRVGTWRFAVQVTETIPGTQTQARDEANFTLKVGPGEGFGIAPSSLPVATVNAPYDATLEARGGTPPFTWSLIVQGQLPRGIRFEIERTQGNREKLHFLGTPEAIPEGEVVAFLATVEDFAGRRAEQPLAIRVVAPPPVVVPPPVDEGCGCASTSGPSARGNAVWALLLLGALLARRKGR